MFLRNYLDMRVSNWNWACFHINLSALQTHSRVCNRLWKYHAHFNMFIIFNHQLWQNKPSYLTDAWLPEEVKLFDDKGVGLFVDALCLGLEDGNGSVCVWYCWLISRLAPLGKSLCNVWLYFNDDSLDTVWLEARGGGEGMCLLGFPVGWGENIINNTTQQNKFKQLYAKTTETV